MRLSFQKTQSRNAILGNEPGGKLPTALSQLQQQRTAVFDMRASVYTSFPLESVTHAGGSGGSLVGGLWLTPGALRGYSAPAFCQILRLSHSPGLTGC